MFQTKLTALLILLFAATDLLVAQDRHFQQFPDDSTTYLWPTTASNQLSSTFAETRSAHLHSGIDIRTWGREGYRVMASRDGYIYRVATGPHGYGNVIYMKHPDNTYTVYAHLNRFEDNLQAYVDSIRLIDFRFEVDLHLNSKEFSFEQGDLIGYSGSTGVGPPHLHFEVRDSNFTPINPLRTNLRVRDTLPPVFRQLAIEFFDSETLHRLGHTILTPGELTDGVYHFGEYSVDQPVGIAVNVHDRANDTPNVYAVHTLILKVDADTLFHSEADYFSFRDTQNMFIDRSYPILYQTRRGFQRLFTVNGNRLPFYKNVRNRGLLTLEKGEHEVNIIAKDIFGNESRAKLTLNVTEDLDKRTISSLPAYPSYQPLSDQRLQKWVSSRIPFEKSLFASATTDFSFFQNREYTHYVSMAEKTARRTLHPNTFETISTSDEKMWIQFPSVSLYDTLDIKLQVQEFENHIDITFNPVMIPLNQSISFNYLLPESFKDRNQLALFSVDSYRGTESFINSTIESGLMRAKLSRITNLRIRKDRVAPWVGTPRIEQNLGGTYVVILPTVDSETKIDYRRSVITVNDSRGIIEYDPEKDLLIFYHPDFTPQSSNIISYEVYDGAGNLTNGTVNLPFRR